MLKVFLGGTCNGSKWRQFVKTNANVDFFDPVVEVWNEEAREREKFEKQNCDICIYVITPKMTGVYAIAEVTYDACKRPGKTVFCFVGEDEGVSLAVPQIKSLMAVKELLETEGVPCFTTLEDLVQHLNRLATEVHPSLFS